MLEEKLSKRRKRRMEQLEKRQVEETKVRRHFEGYKFIGVEHYYVLTSLNKDSTTTATFLNFIYKFIGVKHYYVLTR